MTPRPDLDEAVYLLDSQGFVRLSGVIGSSMCEDLRAALSTDAIRSATRTHGCVHTGFGAEWFYSDDAAAADGGPVDLLTKPLFDMGSGFRRLVTRDRIEPLLTQVLGEDHRLDHAYAIVADASRSSAGRHQLHNGGTPAQRSMSYFSRGGTIVTGLCAVQFALTDTTIGSGTFACVPGSHKAEFPRPSSLDNDHPAVCPVELTAGDALVFTEALAHGSTVPAAHRRTVLMYKYAPAFMAWEPGGPLMGAESSDWTEAERARLRAPSVR